MTKVRCGEESELRIWIFAVPREARCVHDLNGVELGSGHALFMCTGILNTDVLACGRRPVGGTLVHQSFFDVISSFVAESNLFSLMLHY